MESLEQLAVNRKIKVHEPFAQFLKAEGSLCNFEISLLDCYRLAGHACHAITGAYLVTEAAVQKLFPNGICERGGLEIAFGSELEEMATGPRSNIVSYITGAWPESGFPGLGGKNFRRKNLISYGDSSLPKNVLKFKKLSTGEAVIVHFNPEGAFQDFKSEKPFPDKWREEIPHILLKSQNTIRVEEI